MKRCCTSSAAARTLRPALGMHGDSGMLGQMFPEFKAINCRVVRDFYHKSTVDEHTLLTIRTSNGW